MQLDPGSRLLSDLVFVRTYSEKLQDGKKERVDQTIGRTCKMHTDKFPHLKDEIEAVFQSVHNRHVVPSMRSMQFAGYAVNRSNVRIFNCAFTPIEGFKDIADVAFISMNGAGVGFSVQSRHVSKLPVIVEAGVDEVMVIPDTKEGWADSILQILNKPFTIFDYRLIREKGSPLSTGGTASGPESLAILHARMRQILVSAIGRQLKTIEVHDILCHIGDLVFCGGVRRTALISLFDALDYDMLTCKHGSWWDKNPQRARSNNSAVIHRQDPDVEAKIKFVLNMCFTSKAGEPGIVMTNDYDWGVNPCVEIALRPRQFCNLTEINAAACKTEEDFLKAAEDAAIIGTLQASYTNFDYIDSRWGLNCDEEALLGVSITGQAESGVPLTDELLRRGAERMKEVNAEWADKIGINPAARIGCTKPSGSTSAWLGTSSGIHGAHDEYYLRRVRVDKDQNAPIVNYLTDIFGIGEPDTGCVVEKDMYSNDVVVVTIPVMKKGAILRDKETSVQLMERAKHIYKNWIVPSHKDGKNYHNVSLTVSYKQSEVEEISSWIVQNRDCFTGISLLPFDGGSYKQMPFESITEEQFNKWSEKYPDGIDLFSLDYSATGDTRKGEMACAGGACEIY